MRPEGRNEIGPISLLLIFLSTYHKQQYQHYQLIFLNTTFYQTFCLVPILVTVSSQNSCLAVLHDVKNE